MRTLPHRVTQRTALGAATVQALLLLLGSTPAVLLAAPSNRIAIGDISPDSGLDLIRLRQGLVDELGNKVDVRHLHGAALKADCRDLPDRQCLLDAARVQLAGELVELSEIDDGRVDIALVNVQSGAEMARLSSEDHSPSALRDKVLQLLATAGYTGRVIIDGLQVFDHLRIDNRDIEISVPQTMVDLPIGQHFVELQRVGDGNMRQLVFVEYQKELHMDSASMARATTEKPERRQNLPTRSLLLAGGGAALLLASAVVAGHLLVYTLPRLDWLQQQQLQQSGCTDGSGDCWTDAVDAQRTTGIAETAIAVFGALAGTGLIAVAAYGWTSEDRAQNSAGVTEAN